MRFQAFFRRDRLKSLEQTLSVIITILKQQSKMNYPVMLVYVASQNQIRLLVQRTQSPVVLVLQNQMFHKIISTSSHKNVAHEQNNVEPNKQKANENCSIGFQFKDHTKFFQELMLALKLDNEGFQTEESNLIKIKLGRDKQFRYLQLKVLEKSSKIEVQKPTKEEQQLFSYEWIDGARFNKIFFHSNNTNILQILKFASKCQHSYPIQMLEQKLLQLEINPQEKQMKIKLKTENSVVQGSGIISIEGNKEEEETFLYEIRIQDCEMLLAAVKKQSAFIIDEDSNLVLNYVGQNYNCQISLNHWAYQIRNKNYERRALKKEN